MVLLAGVGVVKLNAEFTSLATRRASLRLESREAFLRAFLIGEIG